MNEPESRSRPGADILARASHFAARAGAGKARVAFIESKTPDHAYVETLLALCQGCNQWANRGPLYHALAESFEAHMHLPRDLALTPCANGGIALEALARFHDVKAGKPLRWVGSAFSFSNLGRGYFADMIFVDCDSQGMLDLDEVAKLDPASYDGLIVTNIFGLWRDFSRYIAFAKTANKPMLIDNAAGIDERVPDWPYQAFSLHHTKPYGFGEGALLASPNDEAEAIYRLLNYGETDGGQRLRWFNNGKLSDVACAYHLDRLAKHGQWAPRYREQAARVGRIARAAGLTPLVAGADGAPATSRPYLAPGPIGLDDIAGGKNLTFGKYYKPLSGARATARIFDRLVNIPTHPDVAQLGDDMLKRELEHCLKGGL